MRFYFIFFIFGVYHTDAHTVQWFAKCCVHSSDCVLTIFMCSSFHGSLLVFNKFFFLSLFVGIIILIPLSDSQFYFYVSIFLRFFCFLPLSCSFDSCNLFLFFFECRRNSFLHICFFQFCRWFAIRDASKCAFSDGHYITTKTTPN